MKRNTNNLNTAPQKKRHGGCLTFLIVFFALFALFAYAIVYTTQNTDVSQIGRYIELSKEQGAAIDSVLKECGIEKIDAAEHDELLDNAHMDGETGYRLTYGNIDNIIMYLDSDNAVYSVRYADYDLYADNTTVAKITDYCLTTDEATEIELKCEEIVKQVLNNPNTAEFPNILSWKFSKNKNTVIAQSYVTAQNGFGADVQSTFQITIDTDTNTVVSFIFDGNEMISSN